MIIPALTTRRNDIKKALLQLNSLLQLNHLPFVAPVSIKTSAAQAFTLAELLLSLLILAIIATFSIPKILNASQNSQFNSAAKEAAGTLTAAYATLQQKGSYAGTPTTNLIQFINYVKYDTISVIDDAANTGGGTLQCGSSTPCLKLHNGGLLYFWTQSFQAANCTTNLSNAFTFDPDGIHNSSIPSVEFELFNNGRLSTWGEMTSSDYYSSGTCAGTAFGAGPYDPSWFHW